MPRPRLSPLPIAGDRYGLWTVLQEGPQGGPPKYRKRWFCRCDCGVTRTVDDSNLRGGHTTSCGCRTNKPFIEGQVRTNHGHSSNPVYAAWLNMVSRCTDPQNIGYHRYGGRGITICERWLSFENFLADMGERPSANHSIDRYPDNNGNYEPDNCRWATRKEQVRNRRCTVMIVYQGISKPMAEWAEIKDIQYMTLFYRLYRLGWSVEQSLNTPVRK
jgi:hypothetical protein